MPISATVVSELTFVQLIVGIVVGLILVYYWQIFFDNFIFKKLRVKKTSAYQTFIVALTLTVLFIVFINFVPSIVQGIILGTGRPNNVAGTYDTTTITPTKCDNMSARRDNGQIDMVTSVV